MLRVGLEVAFSYYLPLARLQAITAWLPSVHINNWELASRTHIVILPPLPTLTILPRPARAYDSTASLLH